MKNKRPFYRNGIVIGLVLFIVGACVNQQSSSVGALIALVGLLILIITPIKRLIDKRKGKGGNEHQEDQLSNHFTEVNNELAQKEQQKEQLSRQLAELSDELDKKEKALSDKDGLCSGKSMKNMSIIYPACARLKRNCLKLRHSGMLSFGTMLTQRGNWRLPNERTKNTSLWRRR